MAGTVRGSKQINSTSFDTSGTRRRIQVMVGTSSTIVRITVATHSNRVIPSPLTRPGAAASSCLGCRNVDQVDQVRLPLKSRVEKSKNPKLARRRDPGLKGIGWCGSHAHVSHREALRCTR